MALGFIKKMFSFGSKGEEQDHGAVPPPPAPLPEEPSPAPVAEQTARPLETPAAELVTATTLYRPKAAPAEPENPAAATGFPDSEAMALTPETMPAPDQAATFAERPTEPISPPPQPETVEQAGEAAIDPPAPAEPAQPTPRTSPDESSGIRITTGRAASQELPAAPSPKLSWFQRLRQGLSRSSAQLTDQIGSIFLKRKLDDETLQDLEDVLIQADLGLETAMRITDTLASGRYGKDIAAGEVQAIMASEIEKALAPVARPLELDLSHKPHVILVVGVNGTGKTTTIGKLAAKLTGGGLKVTMAAGDTFRAAAIEQLKIWGERTGAEVVASKLGADAAGLAYDGFERARSNGSDVLIIDTAGRLQNKTELMAELEKIVRVLNKQDPDAPHTVLQTLDATTGQNALNQVEIFRNVAGVNGLVMTKLDGSARGGILVAIAAKHKLPVYFIGVGEGIDDLEPFEAKEFAAAIAGTPLARAAS